MRQVWLSISDEKRKIEQISKEKNRKMLKENLDLKSYNISKE